MPIVTGVPPELPQKIIFMERPAEEVVRSQRSMLKRDGKVGSTTEDDRMSAIYADYLKDFNEAASQNSNIEVLPICYHDILKTLRRLHVRSRPLPCSRRISKQWLKPLTPSFTAQSPARLLSNHLRSIARSVFYSLSAESP